MDQELEIEFKNMLTKKNLRKSNHIINLLPSNLLYKKTIITIRPPFL